MRALRIIWKHTRIDDAAHGRVRARELTFAGRAATTSARLVETRSSLAGVRSLLCSLNPPCAGAN